MTADPERRGRAALVVLCVAQFMVVLDTTVVAVALPDVGTELGSSGAALPWVLSLYAVGFGSLLLGRGASVMRSAVAGVLIAGLLVFTIASLACGLAGSPAVLLAARAVQGAGAAAVSATALALLLTVFTDGRARAAALGASSAVGGAAGASGLLLGGLLTEAVGRRWLFLINVPVGLWAAHRARSVLPATPGTSRRPDVPATALSVIAVAALIVGLGRSGEPAAGAADTMVALGLAVAACGGLVVQQSRAVDPLLPRRALTLSGPTRSSW